MVHTQTLQHSLNKMRQTWVAVNCHLQKQWLVEVFAGLVLQGPQSVSVLCSAGVADLGEREYRKPHPHTIHTLMKLTHSKNELTVTLKKHYLGALKAASLRCLTY